ncbi:type II toxin-antitoxin system VapB family antitoxin [Janibacter cremeus]|uniref:type II toxin-antitoxin system VapB family antitoxin n=1 Tax=Janibacter cremeus TaxID=1285192 RepID=UPI0023F684C7|nr:type II toxin-antitoxin system VapB family antitoxin [Janibacter cremeus]WEV78821.1 type II toxin-antitoxin system VapB family antitoxin [Janibacter cremeus]
MAMNIKNERVHELAREAARRAGTTQTSVLEAALEQYLEVLRAEDGTSGTAAKLVRARDIVHRMRSDMTDEQRSGIRHDLEALYDEDGLPA